MFVVGGLHLATDLILRIRLRNPARCLFPGGATAAATGTMRQGCGLTARQWNEYIPQLRYQPSCPH